MAGPNADSFQRALNKFKESLSPGLIDQFSMCTLQDVRDICRDIQQQQGPEGKLRHMRRLESFIEAMEQFGKVIEVFVNVNDVVCFVWGPVKFLLGVARTYLDSFDRLLDAYAQIGNAIPGLQKYGATFEKYPALAHVLGDYYSDVLNFHKAAVHVFNRPKWKTIFHSTWKTFDADFRPILHSLESRRELLESEKVSAALYEIQAIRQGLSDRHAEETRRIAQNVLENHKDRVSCIRGNLQAPNYQVDQEIATEDRYGNSSGMWIFEHPNFQAWSGSDVAGHGVLYVNGIPGAGKTTLMSAVIEKLQDSKQSGANKCCIAYFYFKHNVPDKESHNSLLRAILEQLIDQDPVMSDHLFKEISVIEGTKLRSTKTLEKLVRTALENYQISYVILDGLDECASNEASKSVSWFLSIVNEEWKRTNAMLRVLFCGQRDGVLDKLLANWPSISLETSRHVEDICLYCQEFCKRIQEKFDITAELENDIASRVMDEAQGMFLYARVMLGNLLSQTTRSGLQQEIAPGTFPKGIEKAYERVAVRIFEKSSAPERKDALTILGRVTCAGRHLRWREIQSFFCIDPAQGTVDYEGKSLRVTCKDLCGSLIDVHYAVDKKASPEDIIKIVHETAREYLFQRGYLSFSLENARLAIFCSRYLTSEPFRCGLNEADIVNHGVNGYYALQDYAVKYWYKHIRECVKPTSKLDHHLVQEVIKSAHGFLMSYANSLNTGDCDDTNRYEEVCRALNDLPEDESERNARFNIELRTTLIRQKIETLYNIAQDLVVQEILTQLYGTLTPYKCSKPWCEFFAAGFESAEDRKRHVNRHNLPFRCTFQGCFASQLGYDTQLKLERHTKDHHDQPGNELKFPKVSTKKGVTIWSAATRGDVSRVKELLDSGTDVDRTCRASERTPLYLAIKSGHFDICKLLLERGADSNYDTFLEQNLQTTLYAAVLSRNFDIVHLLISQPECQPDKTDRLGRSPFLEACALGHLDIVKLLLETGKIQTDIRPMKHPESCKIALSGKTPLTPLGYACIEGHFPVVQYLLQQGLSSSLDMDTIKLVLQLCPQAIVDLLTPAIAHLPNVKLSDGWSIVSSEFFPRLDIDLVHTFRDDSAVCSIGFSNDGKFVATGNNRSAQIYDVATGDKLHVLSHNFIGVFGDMYVRSVCFSPNSTYLATAAEDKRIRVWDIQSESLQIEFSGHTQDIYSVAFSPNGNIIASGSGDRTVKLWDIQTSSNILTLDLPDGVVSVALSHQYIAAGSLDNSVMIWDFSNGTLVKRLDGADGHRNSVYSVAFSPDGKSLISGSWDKTIKMWDLTTPRGGSNSSVVDRQLVKTFEGHSDFVGSCVITSDAQWVISGSRDGEVRFWDPRTGLSRIQIRGRHGAVTQVASSPTGGYLAIASAYKAACIWAYKDVENA